MGRVIKHDSNSVIVTLTAIDDPTGVPETGVNELTTGIEFYFWRPGESIVSISPVSVASESTAYTSAAIYELNTGQYLFHAPVSAASAGASMFAVWGKATSIIFLRQEYDLYSKVIDDLNDIDGTGVTLDVTHEASVVDAIWDEVLTGATHNVANSSGRRLRGIQEFQGYEDGAIWIDTVNGTAGTTSYENGTVENPVDTIADANTIAAALNLNRFRVAPNSSITFAAAQTNQVFIGDSWTLVFGSQDIGGTTIIGANLSGVASNGSVSPTYIVECFLGDVTVPGSVHTIGCGIGGSILLASAGDFYFDNCHSGVSGNSTPALDCSSTLGDQNINFRHYSGGIEMKHLGASGTDTMSLEGFGQLILNSTCTSGAMSVRGHFTVTDNAAGAVTLTDGARYDITQAHQASITASSYTSIMSGTNTEVVDALATDTYAEPGQGAPAATTTLSAKINYMYKWTRNRRVSDTASIAFMADDGTTVDHIASVEATSTSFDIKEMITGA